MASLICVLCFSILKKKCDINLVKGKRSIDIAAEIEDFDFVVQPVSKHICRPCLSVVSQRITHRQKLANLDAKLLNDYLIKARANGLTVKMKHSPKRSLSDDFEVRPTKSTEQCESSRPSAPEQSVHGSIVCESDDESSFRPVASSTPVKELPRVASSRPSSQVAYGNTPVVISNQSQNAHDTLVSVKVQWPSQTSDRILPADLCSLGKMMCRGTYTQIARAAWKNAKIREQLIMLFLKEIDKESCNLCSSKEPSILRMTKKNDILNFTMTKFEKELKERTPLLHSVLLTASVRRRRNTEDLFWIPAVCMAAAVCLKNRCPSMTAVQLLNTIFIQHSGLMVRCI